MTFPVCPRCKRKIKKRPANSCPDCGACPAEIEAAKMPEDKAMWASLNTVVHLRTILPDTKPDLAVASVLADWLDERGQKPDTALGLRWMHQSGLTPLMVSTPVWHAAAARVPYRQPWGDKPAHGSLGWYWYSPVAGDPGGPICNHWHRCLVEMYPFAILADEFFWSNDVAWAETLEDSVAWLGGRLRRFRNILEKQNDGLGFRLVKKQT